MILVEECYVFGAPIVLRERVKDSPLDYCEKEIQNLIFNVEEGN
jgi:hypothetical protein